MTDFPGGVEGVWGRAFLPDLRELHGEMAEED